MKNNKGYTIVELIIVIAVVGVISFVAINSASYAFSDELEAKEELLNQRIELIETQAVRYGEDHKELFEESNTTYIRVLDLVENNYLLNSYGNDLISDSQKIKLTLKDDKVEAHLEK